MNLTRQSNVGRELRLDSQPVPFKFTHLARIAFKDFNPTSRTACIATAPMKNVNAGIFDYQNKFLTRRSFRFN
jgi:hypothetical protein